MGLAPGRPSARGTSGCRARWPGAVCAWPVWGLNPRLRGYLIAVVAVGFAAIGGAAEVTRWRPGDAVMDGALLAFGVVTIEVLRRMGEPAGASKDAHGLWELSIAVLLPPFYAMTAPFLVMALAQWRVRRTIPHRRVFSAAAVGLSYGAASLAFHARLERLRPPARQRDQPARLGAAGPGLRDAALDGQQRPGADRDPA